MGGLNWGINYDRLKQQEEAKKKPVGDASEPVAGTEKVTEQKPKRKQRKASNKA